jgi:molybdopterin molybdotransferase
MTDVSRGFESVTRVADARNRLLDIAEPIDRTDQVPLSQAVGHALAEPIQSSRNVPHYRRAAMDGWAVRATDTFGASERSPTVLRESSETGPNEAVRIHTGSVLPSDADAVVMVEQTEQHGKDVEVFDAVAKEENVAPVGEDVEEGQPLYEPGHQLRPSDLALLKSIGCSNVEIFEQPTVGVIPTGEELVQSDPEPGEVIETNGMTVAQYVNRWGGVPTYRDVVTDDHEALRVAIERDLTKDIVVTTGGSSVGERDLIPEVVADLGELVVHGVALKPGHPAAFGVVQDTPIVMLPGYPVACIVNAVQFLRPLLKRVGHRPCESHPTTEARLGRKIRSEPGVKTYARVTLDRSDGTEPPIATPTRASGSGVLSSVALADGWVVVREGREGIPEDETVAVENWEAYP